MCLAFDAREVARGLRDGKIETGKDRNTLLGYPIKEVDNLPTPELVFGDFRAYMEYKIKSPKGKDST